MDQKCKVDNDNQLKTNIPHAYSMGDINVLFVDFLQTSYVRQKTI